MTEHTDPLLDGWTLALRAEGRSPKTITVYRSHARMFAEWWQRDLSSVTSADIRRFVIHQQHKMLSESTIHQRLSALRMLFDFAVDEGDIESNPASKVKVKTPKVKPISCINDEEVNNLLNTCKNSSKLLDVRDYALLLVFVETGIRRAELLSMTVPNTYVDEGALVIRRKGGNTGVVYIGVNCRRALAKWLRRRQALNSQSDSVWITTRKTPLSYSQAREVVRMRALRAGIGPVHPHQLRHYFADRFRRSGGNDSELLVLAGWSSRKMLDRYGRGNAQQRAKEAAMRYSYADSRGSRRQ